MAELKLTIDANKALRDAVAHLRAVLDWSNTERFAGRTRHENDAPSSARSFLDGLDELQTSPKTSKDLDLCDECGCIGLCDPRCSLVPVQQDEPEGVCAFPNCSCTENRCPAKGERGPFCDHGFHPRLCGRCAPVPEAVTDEDEVQCQMCKTVQPRPDKECGHCGAGPKYLCPIHTRPAAAPVQQERSVRAPKTDDPHSLPRVDDLLDDIPVQQEPEGCGNRCGESVCTKPKGHDEHGDGKARWVPGDGRPEVAEAWSAAVPSVGLNNDDQDGELFKDSVFGVSSVPSVGLRDRLACELANLEYERSGRLCETEDFCADADRVLSVLHEAGTQGEREQRDEDIKVDLLRSVVAVFKETDDWDAISKLRVAMPLLMTPPSWPHDHSGAAPQSCPDCSRTVSGDREQFVLHRLFDCSAWPLSAEAGTQEDEIDV